MDFLLEPEKESFLLTVFGTQHENSSGRGITGALPDCGLTW
jgi:hypothetical protein